MTSCKVFGDESCPKEGIGDEFATHTPVCVIVPVFNVEQYLERCVDSIVGQTFNGLSIILIDDGSTDASGAICDRYSVSDARICAVHTANLGLSAARNLGIEIALLGNCQFIMFVDADDYLNDRTCEILVNAIREHSADVAQCGFARVSPRRTIYRSANGAYRGRKEIIPAHLDGEIVDAVWGKLYRRELFERIRFPDGKNHEDVATTHRVLLLCDTVICVPYCGYNYVMREGSIVHTHTMENLRDRWEAHKARYECLLAEAADALSKRHIMAMERGLALSVATTWRWAYGCGATDCMLHQSDFLGEMTDFARVFPVLGCSNWPLGTRLGILFARFGGIGSMAMAYYFNAITSKMVALALKREI